MQNAANVQRQCLELGAVVVELCAIVADLYKPSDKKLHVNEVLIAGLNKRRTELSGSRCDESSIYRVSDN